MNNKPSIEMENLGSSNPNPMNSTANQTKRSAIHWGKIFSFIPNPFIFFSSIRAKISNLKNIISTQINQARGFAGRNVKQLNTHNDQDDQENSAIEMHPSTAPKQDPILDREEYPKALREASKQLIKADINEPYSITKSRFNDAFKGDKEIADKAWTAALKPYLDATFEAEKILTANSLIEPSYENYLSDTNSKNIPQEIAKKIWDKTEHLLEEATTIAKDLIENTSSLDRAKESFYEKARKSGVYSEQIIKKSWDDALNLYLEDLSKAGEAIGQGNKYEIPSGQSKKAWESALHLYRDSLSLAQHELVFKGTEKAYQEKAKKLANNTTSIIEKAWKDAKESLNKHQKEPTRKALREGETPLSPTDWLVQEDKKRAELEIDRIILNNFERLATHQKQKGAPLSSLPRAIEIELQDRADSEDLTTDGPEQAVITEKDLIDRWNKFYEKKNRDISAIQTFLQNRLKSK